MKFTVETISDGRCLIDQGDGVATITSDEDLGTTLRRLTEGKPPKKRPYPSGVRRRKRPGVAPPAGTEGRVTGGSDGGGAAEEAAAS